MNINSANGNPTCFGAMVWGQV